MKFHLISRPVSATNGTRAKAAIPPVKGIADKIAIRAAIVPTPK